MENIGQMKQFKHIRAYHTGFILPLVDFLILYPILLVMRRKTTHGIQLKYHGDKQLIEQDIRQGAFFMTNHRDIVMDAAWLTFLLRTRYFIHPYFDIIKSVNGCCVKLNYVSRHICVRQELSF